MLLEFIGPISFIGLSYIFKKRTLLFTDFPPKSAIPTSDHKKSGKNMLKSMNNEGKASNRQSFALRDFTFRLKSEWLLPYCDAKGYSDEGFDWNSIERLSPVDAADFMQAIDKGIVTHKDGVFLAVQSKAKEWIFWEGRKDSSRRKITLWLEPIITVAGLMRLHHEHGWPGNQLGLQSKNWAFDLVAYDLDLETERIACEVKKSIQEIEAMLEFMELHRHTNADAVDCLVGPERNAFKKVIALRESPCQVFWALGPNRGGYVFNVSRTSSGAVCLELTTESALKLSR